MTVFLQTLASGLTLGSVYALIALGFTFIFASTHVVNFAQGDWAMIVGMIAATVVASSLGIFWAAVIAPIAGAAIGFLAYRIFFGFARSMDTMTISLVLLGASLFLEGFAVLIWGPDPRGISQLATLPPIKLAGAVLPLTSVIVLTATVALLLIVVFFLTLTKAGRATIAVAQNREAAALCGIDVTRVIMISFVLSGIFAGIAGGLITPITSMYYQGGVTLTFKGFAAAAIGGLRNTTGAVVGGFALGLMEAFAASYIGRGTAGQEIGLVLPLMVLIAIGPRLQASGTRSEEAAETFTADVAADAANL